MTHPLFRNEVHGRRSERLTGDVSIAVPVAWRAIGYLLFGSAVAALLFLSLADYARIVNAPGAVVPDSGVTSIVPTRSGVITGIEVVEDQKVTKGQILIAIRSEEDSAGGISPAAQVEASITRQDNDLLTQAAAVQSAAMAQQGQLAAQRAGLKAEISQIQTQIALQRELVESARLALERTRSIAKRGFISGRDLQARQEALLSRQQDLAQLTQSLTTRRSAITEAERSAVLVAEQARGQASNLAASRAQLAQQAANASGARAYVLRAPVTGKVAALTARTGQPASAEVPLMAIVPSGSVLRAELEVPSSAIGFVKPGQTVRLAVDAFPYQRFGTVQGKVVSVANSAVSRRREDASVFSAYPVIVSLDRASVAAFGRDEPLIPGMTLSARIVAEKQSLIRWLFEPLFAVQQR